MKRKVLLLVGALVTVFTTASAWEKPAAPKSQPLAADGVTEQYIYNVGTEGFLLGANDWNTRASVSLTKGYKWKVEMVDENGPYYTLTDCVETKKNEWMRMFCDGINSIWVDNNTGANNATWTINLGDGDIFTIGNSAWEGLFGANASDGYRCCFTSHYAEATTEWYSVAVEEYERYIVAAQTYAAALELKAAIDAAKEKYPNIDLSAQEAVYNNEGSTVEEIQNAIAGVEVAVKQAAKEEAIASASVDNPIDMTTYIVNPNFDGIKFDGWGGSKWGAGGTTDECAERYSMTFDTYQDIADLPKGVYRILVNGFFRGNAENTPYLYGASTTDTLKVLLPARDAGGSTEPIDDALQQETIVVDGVTYYVPNSMRDFVRFENAGFYNDVTVFAPVNEDGKLRIGVKKDKNTDGDWVIVDSFRLFYLGQAADAYQVVMDAQLKNFPDYSDAAATESLKEQYADVIEKHSTASSMEEVRANIAAIEEAAKLLEENIAAWAKFIAKLAVAQETLQDENIDQSAPAVLELSDYLMEAEDVVNNKELTTEEIETQINTLEAMINAAMQCLKSGADFTRFLKSPEMDSAAGWNGSPTINQKCGEKYGTNGDFDVYQIVDADVPVGLYEISMQGFYREFRDDDANKTAWRNVFEDTDDARTFKEGCPKPIAWVYMNSNKNPLNCVYEYPQEGTYDAETGKFECDFYGSGFSVDPYNKYAYPNDMATAAKAFAQGAYQVSAFGLVAKDGDKLRIGVKGHLGGSDWAIFDNFKLTFRAKDETIINQLLPDAKVALDLTNKVVGKDVRELVTNTLQQAESAASADEKFEALAKCFELNETVEASVKLFDNLFAAIGELETAIGVSEASAKTKTEAGTLLDNASLGYSGGYTDAEAKAAIDEINEMIKLLAIPEFLGSDENPVDMTAFIKDASFDGLSVSGNKYGAWTWKKKEGNGPNFTNAFEFWASAAANLEFSLTQELVGLPAAKYELKAMAGNSFNGQESNGESGRAYLFAEIAGKSVVPSVAVEPSGADATVYADYSVIFTVGEGDVVTIGFKTVGTMEARWFSGDEFELWCYGTESTKADTPDAIAASSAIENVTADGKVSPVVIYNAAGAKIPSLQKGLNIIRMSNGKTRKVMVK